MFNRVIVAVIGTSNSGKTSAIEVIIKGIIKKGYTVATVKHIPEEEFTIDTPGKDTWRFIQAGANIVLSVAPKEITRIKKNKIKKNTLEKIIGEIPDEIDVIIIEGFKKLIENNVTIPKIVATKNNQEIIDAVDRYKNIIAIVGSNQENIKDTKIPFFNTLNDKEKFINYVLKQISVLIERKKKRNQKITIKINEEILPLGRFVQDIIRNSVLAMITSLKGVKIKGEEKVSIIIE